MPAIYIILIIIAAFVLTKRIKRIVYDIKIKNNGKLKADILFLILTILVICILIYLTGLK